jgi:tripartite-type tricarboxylate transporter receptor subunit TctC
MLMQRRPVLVAAALALGLAAALPARAAWPTDKPIQLVVPYAPGGTADALSRLIAEQLGPKLGTTVIVVNRAGASGVIGQSSVAQAPADGYTVLYDATPFSINPHLQKLPYDPKKDLQPVMQVGLTPMLLAVPKNSPYTSVQDLVKVARQSPGKLTFSSGGQGTVQYMGAELFLQGAGLKALHVPYKSGGPGIQAIMAGEVDFGMGNLPALSAHVKSGMLRPLAITSGTRNENYADVPTIAESAVKGFEVYEWNGIFAPAGTPRDIVQRLNAALREVLQTTQMKARLYALGSRVVASSPEEFAKFLAQEEARWAATVKAAGIKRE